MAGWISYAAPLFLPFVIPMRLLRAAPLFLVRWSSHLTCAAVRIFPFRCLSGLLSPLLQVAAVDALSRESLSRLVRGVLLSAPAAMSLRGVEALGPLRSVLLPLPTPVELLARWDSGRDSVFLSEVKKMTNKQHRAGEGLGVRRGEVWRGGCRNACGCASTCYRLMAGNFPEAAYLNCPLSTSDVPLFPRCIVAITECPPRFRVW